MTAEIAILNRSAVALAADSAVTVNVGGQPKIYNSVDKLFHLSVDQPVGIMIFGSAEFMGIPIETVIKKFRKSKFCKPQKKLKDYAQAFFDFLEIEKEIPVPEELIYKNVETIITEAFSAIRSRSVDRYLHAATTGGIGKKSPVQFLEDEINSLVNARIVYLDKRADIVKFDEKDTNNAALIEKVFSETINLGVKAETKAGLVKMAGLLIRKDVFSNGAMGLVFAGFGQEEMFPKLQAFYSDGITGVGRHVKRQQFEYVDIKRSGDHCGARIEAFAQKEMVERFLDGIDPGFESYLRSAMKKALNDLGTEVLASFVRASKAKKKIIADKISDAAEKYLKEFSEKSDKRKEDNYRNRILDMVKFMPKSDLANMAESLINLTSTKRRVSAETETVGGPIDVAVISKYDGFVWIKRKHYFTKELNPRYFASHVAARSSVKEAT